MKDSWIPYEDGKERLKDLFEKNPDTWYFPGDIVEKDEQLWCHLATKHVYRACVELECEGVLEVDYIVLQSAGGPYGKYISRRYKWRGAPDDNTQESF